MVTGIPSFLLNSINSYNFSSISSNLILAPLCNVHLFLGSENFNNFASCCFQYEIVVLGRPKYLAASEMLCLFAYSKTFNFCSILILRFAFIFILAILLPKLQKNIYFYLVLFLLYFLFPFNCILFI